MDANARTDAKRTHNRVYAKVLAGARRVGAFNNRVILTLAFALAFVPVGIARRLRRKDPLRRRFDAAIDSYRIRRDPAQAPDLTRPY
jgi:hypothetical protein